MNRGDDILIRICIGGDNIVDFDELRRRVIYQH